MAAAGTSGWGRQLGAATGHARCPQLLQLETPGIAALPDWAATEKCSWMTAAAGWLPPRRELPVKRPYSARGRQPATPPASLPSPCAGRSPVAHPMTGACCGAVAVRARWMGLPLQVAAAQLVPHAQLAAQQPHWQLPEVYLQPSAL